MSDRNYTVLNNNGNPHPDHRFPPEFIVHRKGCADLDRGHNRTLERWRMSGPNVVQAIEEDGLDPGEPGGLADLGYVLLDFHICRCAK